MHASRLPGEVVSGLFLKPGGRTAASSFDERKTFCSAHRNDYVKN
jgi:hypothetical protein